MSPLDDLREKREHLARLEAEIAAEQEAEELDAYCAETAAAEDARRLRDEFLLNELPPGRRKPDEDKGDLSLF